MESSNSRVRINASDIHMIFDQQKSILYPNQATSISRENASRYYWGRLSVWAALNIVMNNLTPY